MGNVRRATARGLDSARGPWVWHVLYGVALQQGLNVLKFILKGFINTPNTASSALPCIVVRCCSLRRCVGALAKMSGMPFRTHYATADQWISVFSMVDVAYRFLLEVWCNTPAYSSHNQSVPRNTALIHQERSCDLFAERGGMLFTTPFSFFFMGKGTISHHRDHSSRMENLCDKRFQ